MMRLKTRATSSSAKGSERRLFALTQHHPWAQYPNRLSMKHFVKQPASVAQGARGSSATVPSSHSAKGGDMTGCVNLTFIFLADGGTAKRTEPCCLWPGLKSPCQPR